MIQKLVLCTSNQGKIRELRALLSLDIELMSLSDVGVDTELPETGLTLHANALQKASFVHAKCQLPCLADDTGLEVNALGGAPGVHSARYGGHQRDDRKNMDQLLSVMQGVLDRSARFRTVLAFVSKEQTHYFEGVVHGRISHEKKGIGGFGYDPLFIPEGQEQTFSEMAFDVKNSLSHRAMALRSFVDHIHAGSPNLF